MTVYTFDIGFAIKINYSNVLNAKFNLIKY